MIVASLGPKMFVPMFKSLVPRVKEIGEMGGTAVTITIVVTIMVMVEAQIWQVTVGLTIKELKAKIRNRYDQVPHLARNTI